MRTIPVQELSYDAFRKFGDYMKLLDDSAYRTMAAPGRTNEFYPDLMQFFFNPETPVSACMCCVSKEEVAKVGGGEFHGKTCEGILPLDADCVIYVAPAGRTMNPDQVEAFRIPKGTFVRLNVGVYHGRQFTYDTDMVHILVMLPQRTYGNNCDFVRLGDDDAVIVDIK